MQSNQCDNCSPRIVNEWVRQTRKKPIIGSSRTHRMWFFFAQLFQWGSTCRIGACDSKWTKCGFSLTTSFILIFQRRQLWCLTKSHDNLLKANAIAHCLHFNNEFDCSGITHTSHYIVQTNTAINFKTRKWFEWMHVLFGRRQQQQHEDWRRQWKKFIVLDANDSIPPKTDK